MVLELSRVRSLRSVVAFLALLALARGAHGVETTVQNDSVTDFGQVTVQGGFVANERAAAWLTSPCAGTLVAVQVYWRSLTGTTGGTIGESIQITNAGTFPVPGTELALLLGPFLQDGFLNEFRFLDEQQMVPLAVPVTEGQVFVVAFRFAETPGSAGASVVTDTSGCQAGKNSLFAIPPSTWFSSCQLGVTGDFVIRAVVDCGAVPTDIFADDFETGDTSAWSAVVP
jgi:hypothetical protein